MATHSPATCGVGPPCSRPNLLVPAPGNAADFGEVFSEVLPSSQPQPGSLSTSLAPTGEQLLPDLLISPHMLPRKNPREGGGGRADTEEQLGGWRMTKRRTKMPIPVPAWLGGKWGGLMMAWPQGREGEISGQQNGEAWGSWGGWACLSVLQ